MSPQIVEISEIFAPINISNIAIATPTVQEASQTAETCSIFVKRQTSPRVYGDIMVTCHREIMAVPEHSDQIADVRTILFSFSDNYSQQYLMFRFAIIYKRDSQSSRIPLFVIHGTRYGQNPEEDTHSDSISLASIDPRELKTAGVNIHLMDALNWIREQNGVVTLGFPEESNPLVISQPDPTIMLLVSSYNVCTSGG